MVRSVISILTMLDTPSLVPTAKNIERCPLFRTRRSLPNAETRARAALTSFSTRNGVLTTSGVKSTVSIGLASETSAFHWSKGMIFWMRL
jgi:hypothetical protein